MWKLWVRNHFCFIYYAVIYCHMVKAKVSNSLQCWDYSCLSSFMQISYLKDAWLGPHCYLLSDLVFLLLSEFSHREKGIQSKSSCCCLVLSFVVSQRLKYSAFYMGICLHLCPSLSAFLNLTCVIPMLAAVPCQAILRQKKKSILLIVYLNFWYFVIHGIFLSFQYFTILPQNVISLNYWGLGPPLKLCSREDGLTHPGPRWAHKKTKWKVMKVP